MGEWFLPFLHGWRCAAARLGKMAKKPETQGAELSGRPGVLAPFYNETWGAAQPPCFDRLGNRASTGSVTVLQL
jgi:hypothetical protein